MAAAAFLAAAWPVHGADRDNGRLIAHGGDNPTACFHCHGLDGGGDDTGAVPRLAGLGEYYLAKQMRDFAGGTRPHGVMGPIARQLSDADKQDVAAYYAGLPPPSSAARPMDPALLDLGGRIARDGVPGRRVPACVDCHGVEGRSAVPAIPALAGQHARYLVLQLGHWRGGRRHNDPLNGMELFSRLMLPAEIEAVAAWFAHQPAEPKP